jgi:hypothetical protein
MVVTAEEWGGGGFPFNGIPPNGNGEPTLDDPEYVEQIKEQFDQVKKYLPYIVMIGATLAWKHFKKNGLDKSIDTVALSNVIAGFTPVITAFAWYMLTTVNDTAKKLSYIIAAAELTPTVDLNLPPGINLGAYFVAADEMIPLVDQAGNMLNQADKKLQAGLDLIPWWFYLNPAIAPLGVNKIFKDFFGERE